jgi:tRNA A-37 threonylcarbamoyl transferase component Bud32
MSNFDFSHYTFNELKKMGEKMGLNMRRSRESMIKELTKGFQKYEEYKKNKFDKYKKVSKLGEGKEGKTYFVIDKKNKEYAMKTFKKTKSSDTLRTEYNLQKKASSVGVAPLVYDYDTIGKRILMEKMDEHLLDRIKEKKACVKSQQLRILDIFKKLDEVSVFHNDANLSNYMLKGDTIYLIDYGFAKEITPKLKKK